MLNCQKETRMIKYFLVCFAAVTPVALAVPFLFGVAQAFRRTPAPDAASPPEAASYPTTPSAESHGRSAPCSGRAASGCRKGH